MCKIAIGSKYTPVRRQERTPDGAFRDFKPYLSQEECLLQTSFLPKPAERQLALYDRVHWLGRVIKKTVKWLVVITVVVCLFSLMPELRMAYTSIVGWMHGGHYG